MELSLAKVEAKRGRAKTTKVCPHVNKQRAAKLRGYGVREGGKV